MVRAIRAPSVHNTQPWRFVLRPGALEIHADWTRQLPVLDRRGRQLLMSCGCAVMNARVALAAAGLHVEVERPVQAVGDTLVAVLHIDPDAALTDDEWELARLDRRHRERADEPPPLHRQRRPERSRRDLRRGGRQGGFARRHDHARRAPDRRGSLSQLADRMENADPAYRAELRQWTTDDFARNDGVPAFAVPHVDGRAHDDLPIRDFDTHGVGLLPSNTQSSSRTVPAPGRDRCRQRRRRGCAAARPRAHPARSRPRRVHRQPADPGRSRSRARTSCCALELGLGMHPHVLLRVGRAPDTPPSGRRPVAEVLLESS